MTSMHISQASTDLSRLFRAAAGATEAEGKGLATKGLQIADALTDANKRIKLKGAEVDRLLSHVETLKPAEKADAIRLLDYMRDRFEVDNEASAKKLLDTLPKTATPIDVGGRVRTVHQARQESVSKVREASADDIKATDRAIENMAQTAGPHGDTIRGEAAKARKTAFDEGGVKASAEGGGRKAYVESTAKHAGAMAILDEYSASPFFEDRLLAFMMKNGLRFMDKMNETTAKFDDPKRLEDLKSAFNEAAKKMIGLADQLSPDGKARAAVKLTEFLKANPNVDKELPAYRQYVDQLNASGVGKMAANAAPEDILKDLPPPDNAVIAAMMNSDNKAVREFAAVFSAADRAESFKNMTADNIANMSEDDIRKVHGDMKAFAGDLQRMKATLPQDLARDLKDVGVSELPAQIDPTSRQIMFQQINMMMQQYQQIMQALSEVMNKMNEMAMDPIRKMGR